MKIDIDPVAWLAFARTFTAYRQPDRAVALLSALHGIAACSTQCNCCRMHQRIAEKAIADYEYRQRNTS